MEGLIANIRQSPTDDTRKRLFELATSNSGIYFTSHQVCDYGRTSAWQGEVRRGAWTKLLYPDCTAISVRLTMLSAAAFASSVGAQTWRLGCARMQSFVRESE